MMIVFIELICVIYNLVTLNMTTMTVKLLHCSCAPSNSEYRQTQRLRPGSRLLHAHPLNVGPEHEPGDLLAALPLDRHRGRGVRRGGRTGREEGGVVLGAVGQQVERLRLVVVKSVSVTGEHIAAALKH